MAQSARPLPAAHGGSVTARRQPVAPPPAQFAEPLRRHASAVLLRPDRFVAGISYPIEVNELIAAVADKMGLDAGGRAQ